MGMNFACDHIIELNQVLVCLRIMMVYFQLTDGFIAFVYAAFNDPKLNGVPLPAQRTSLFVFGVPDVPVLVGLGDPPILDNGEKHRAIASYVNNKVAIPDNIKNDQMLRLRQMRRYMRAEGRLYDNLQDGIRRKYLNAPPIPPSAACELLIDIIIVSYYGPTPPMSSSPSSSSLTNMSSASTMASYSDLSSPLTWPLYFVRARSRRREGCPR
ncbi:hypothetical protein TrRE_jg7110 [Triparma retinervis]|uniref:Uncharacterized protein n=1 Tax=Triparma retinervis TaxID=2557542 RepID=A0A9W6ZJ05_9STRA|nr:hypothetical protein TrRE_jg7110 [Triparma retinervis]